MQCAAWSVGHAVEVANLGSGAISCLLSVRLQMMDVVNDDEGNGAAELILDARRQHGPQGVWRVEWRQRERASESRASA